MRLVKLTNQQGETIYVNPEAVVFIRPSQPNLGEAVGTAIVGEGSAFIVREDIAAVVAEMWEP